MTRSLGGVLEEGFGVVFFSQPCLKLRRDTRSRVTLWSYLSTIQSSTEISHRLGIVSNLSPQKLLQTVVWILPEGNCVLKYVKRTDTTMAAERARHWGQWMLGSTWSYKRSIGLRQENLETPKYPENIVMFFKRCLTNSDHMVRRVFLLEPSWAIRP